MNSIHHQAIKDLAPTFEAEAFSATDGLVEAIRRKDPGQSYIAAVQWHPEFHQSGDGHHRRCGHAGRLPGRRGRGQALNTAAPRGRASGITRLPAGR